MIAVMCRYRTKIFLLIIISTCVKSFRLNNTAELISTYAKVAHWGVSGKAQEEARSSNGQSLWTHRSDASVRRSQNIRKQPVTYYYSMQVPSSKVDQQKQEPVPSKGEVVQERFNPRPYFDFVFDDPPRQKRPDTKPNGKKESSNNVDSSPSLVYGVPVQYDSPISVPSSEDDSKPPTDVYNSPFSSYNPPNFKPNESEDNEPSYPPLLPTLDDSSSSTLPSPVYGPPLDIYGPPVGKPSPDSDKVKGEEKPTSDDDSLRPPLAPPSSKPDSYYGPPPPVHSDEDSYYLPPPKKNVGNTMSMPSFQYGPPDNNEHNNDDKHMVSPPRGPSVTQTVKPPDSVEPPYLDHPPTEHDYEQYHHQSPPPPPAPASMAEDDLSPPPAGVPYGKIPQYLDHEPNDHDFFHYNHHDVYHEVKHQPTTTTTEAPRAGPYSYYYLGRKLWYIPLYFSVYFIVYVTVLILKSIARHKIQFSHNFDKGRSSRELDVDNINKNVASAIEDVKNKYM